jgi:FKBP-type peptidyl-prolyl cis-trans isomerase FklB
MMPVRLTASALALLLAACGPSGGAGDKSVMEGFTNQTEAAATKGAADNAKAAEDFLAANKTKAGVTTTASGLQYASLATGPAGGASPKPDSVVQVNYEGTLLDGTVFDSSFARGQAAEFTVGDLVPAWVEALQLMKPGDEITLWVPPALGYGDAGMPPGCGPGATACEIPPNSLLVFRMRLERIVSGPGAGTTGVGAQAAPGETR